MAKLKKPTLGVIVGSRGFFPKHLADSGRKTILALLEKQGINAVCLTPEDSPNGAVETINDAEKCADLFKAHRDDIDGILLTLPNFGEERPIANTIRWAGLNVPVLVHAFPDTSDRMTIKDRRDSFCGKMSSCNNLTQYGIKFTLTSLHTVDPESASFIKDLQNFVATCRVVKGLRGARIGALGCAAGGVQYRALQRKVAGNERYQRGYAGPERGIWAHAPLDGQRQSRERAARSDPGVCQRRAERPG